MLDVDMALWKTEPGMDEVGQVTQDKKVFAAAAEFLAESRSLLVLTGAGISKESGVPTYQQAEQGDLNGPSPISFDEFTTDPFDVWRRIDDWRGIIAKSSPNAAHEELACWENQNFFDRFLIATQNVDGLHQAAGSRNVTELHGNVWKLAIPRDPMEDTHDDFSTDYFAWQDPQNRQSLLHKWSDENNCTIWTNKDLPFKQIPPSRDPNVRPHIVMTGEPYGNRLLWVEDFLSKPVDAVLVVGCSGRVGILYRLLQQARKINPDCRIINVNPGADCLHDKHIFMQATACKALQALGAPLKSKQ